MHNQPREPQPYEDCQAKSIQEFEWTSQGMDWGWGQGIKSHTLWLHRYYLNWTKLDNAITKFNNEMHSADNWVLNPVILHYLHNFILCSALLQFVLLKALYK